MAEAGQEIVDDMVADFEKSQAGGEPTLPAPETVPGPEGTGSEPASEPKSPDIAPSDRDTEAEPTGPELPAEGDPNAGIDAVLGDKDFVSKYPQIAKQLEGQRRVFTQYTQKASENEKLLEAERAETKKVRQEFEELINVDLNPRSPGKRGEEFLGETADWRELEEAATEKPAEIERIQRRIEMGEETDELAVQHYRDGVATKKAELQNKVLSERLANVEKENAERRTKDERREMAEKQYRQEYELGQQLKAKGIPDNVAKAAIRNFYGDERMGYTPDLAKALKDAQALVGSKGAKSAEDVAKLVKAAKANAKIAGRPAVGTQPGKVPHKIDIGGEDPIPAFVDEFMASGTYPGNAG